MSNTKPSDQLSFQRSMRDAYQHWEDTTTPIFVTKYTKIVAWIMLCLMIADSLMFEPETFGKLFPHRVFACLVSLATSFTVAKAWAKKKLTLARSLYLVWSVIICTQFTYFLNILGETPHRLSIALGLSVCIIFTNFGPILFRRLQIRLGVMLSFLLAIAVYLMPEYRYELTIAMLSHGCSFSLFGYIGFILSRKISSDHENLVSILGPHAAERVLKSGSIGTSSLEKAFPQRETHAVVLVADWRGSLAMAESLSPSKLSIIHERYFMIAQSLLEDTIFEGVSYFMRSNGDELFIVFHADLTSSVSNTKIDDAALGFAKTFAVDMFREIQNLLEYDLTFDVGVSSGRALIGLFGPIGAKKADIFGDFVAHAKRFESFAKRNRSNTAVDNAPPTVVISRSMALSAHKNFAGLQIHEVSVEVMDNVLKPVLVISQPVKDQIDTLHPCG